MNQIMLDLETMGLGLKPAILSIGAVQFDIKTGEIGNKFHYKVNLQSSIDAGLDVTASTIQFWASQGKESLAYLNDALKSDIELKFALERYVEFVKSCGDNIILWGNGAKADNVWIESALDAFKIKNPVSYRNESCYRTMITAYCNKHGWPSINFEGVKHYPIDDCLYQIKLLTFVMNELKLV